MGEYLEQALINLILIKHQEKTRKGYSCRKEKNQVVISPDAMVTVTQMNHLTEIQYMEKMNRAVAIKKLNKEEYVNLATGEIKEYQHIENRSESYNSLRQTFKRFVI